MESPKKYYFLELCRWRGNSLLINCILYCLFCAATLESTAVIEEISSNTLLFHQVHKRIWPASQRDAIFWSHMRHVPDDKDGDAPDVWVVCNNSIDGDAFPVRALKWRRNVLFYCNEMSRLDRQH